MKMFSDCFDIRNRALDANQSHIGKSHTLHILIIFHEFMFSNKLFVACKFLHVFTHKKNRLLQSRKGSVQNNCIQAAHDAGPMKLYTVCIEEW